MQRSERAAQARRALDQKLGAVDIESVKVRPRRGWMRAVRAGLGMSQSALATRLGVSPPAVAKLERSELDNTISIGKLSEVAGALDCTLVYALVPNTSLEETVQRRARSLAAQMLGYVANTMGLEDQAVEEGRHHDQLERQAQWLVDSNRLWRAE